MLPVWHIIVRPTVEWPQIKIAAREIAVAEQGGISGQSAGEIGICVQDVLFAIGLSVVHRPAFKAQNAEHEVSCMPLHDFGHGMRRGKVMLWRGGRPPVGE